MNIYTTIFDMVSKQTGNKIHCSIISRRLSKMLIMAMQDKRKNPVCLVIPPKKIFDYCLKLFQPTKGTFLLTKIKD